MIFGTLRNHDTESLQQAFGPVSAGVQEALDWAAGHDLAALPCGQHAIDGDRLFVNVVEYETKQPEERFWEAHKAYLDVHVTISGREQIDMNFLGNLACGVYQPEGDFQPADGGKNASVMMQPGDFLVCFPQDAHRTAVACGGKPETVKRPSSRSGSTDPRRLSDCC